MNNLNFYIPIFSFILSVIAFVILQISNNRKHNKEKSIEMQKDAIEKANIRNEIANLKNQMNQLHINFEKERDRTIDAIDKLSQKMDQKLDTVADKLNSTIIELLNKK